MNPFRTVFSEKKCVEAIRANMTKAGCSEEHILSAIANHMKMREQGKVVEVAILT